ncbi:hypothetical protein Tsubulata_025351 [Turnera subulata]|uniref:Uncharacterized protein n=1 Tax=Turnera subulata TaxID=218843 RepID=A0A9Q0JF58_9ROSI|nr:hypothetical protein Tsubulata_025351 [Turnera subulata]
MTSIVSSHHCNLSGGVRDHLCRPRFNNHQTNHIKSSRDFPSRGLLFSATTSGGGHYRSGLRNHWPVFSTGGTLDDGADPDDSGDGDSEKDSTKREDRGVDGELLRENLERIVGRDDSSFSGIDLATLIRQKYGRSYDVQLIKKEFMGRNLLALNVMWKYREQKGRTLLLPLILYSLLSILYVKRSFPLTEEEYILRLDDVANTLKCWGAVSHIRNSLAKLKERPRIGKAVSIFIDMDESGGRANEWIYK